MSSRSTSFTTMILALACGTGPPHVQYSHSAATTHATSSAGLASNVSGKQLFLHQRPPGCQAAAAGALEGSSGAAPLRGHKPVPQLYRASQG